MICSEMFNTRVLNAAESANINLTLPLKLLASVFMFHGCFQHKNLWLNLKDLLKRFDMPKYDFYGPFKAA